MANKSLYDVLPNWLITLISIFIPVILFIILFIIIDSVYFHPRNVKIIGIEINSISGGKNDQNINSKNENDEFISTLKDVYFTETELIVSGNRDKKLLQAEIGNFFKPYFNNIVYPDKSDFAKENSGVIFMYHPKDIDNIPLIINILRKKFHLEILPNYIVEQAVLNNGKRQMMIILP